MPEKFGKNSENYCYFPRALENVEKSENIKIIHFRKKTEVFGKLKKNRIFGKLKIVFTLKN